MWIAAEGGEQFRDDWLIYVQGRVRQSTVLTRLSFLLSVSLVPAEAVAPHLLRWVGVIAAKPHPSAYASS